MVASGSFIISSNCSNKITDLARSESDGELVYLLVRTVPEPSCTDRSSRDATSTDLTMRNITEVQALLHSVTVPVPISFDNILVIACCSFGFENSSLANWATVASDLCTL